MNTTIIGCSLNSIRHRNGFYENENKSRPLQIQVVDSLNTAILKIESFDKSYLRKQHGIKFSKQLKQIFHTISNENIEFLVIDLRGNNGGNPEYAVDVLQHVLSVPFNLILESRKVCVPTAEKFEDRTKTTWYPFYGLGTRKPKRSVFAGEIFVLIDESCFSTAVMLPNALKRCDRATLVGRETGGNPIVMSGYFLKTTWNLPNTQIGTSPGILCTLGGSLDENYGRGIIPDIETIAKTDILNFTLELIGKKQLATKPNLQ